MAVLAAGVFGYRALNKPSPPSGPPCRVTLGTVTYEFDAEQAVNATTIAAVGKRLALPNHAVTVALATALQESGLHNLDFGDRDSLGLFQQRPSQGWGTPAQIMSPRDAAAAFYRRLVRVPGWQAMPLTVAAQAVQRSAKPDGYAQWDPQARLLARALTGEVPAAFTCRAQVHAAIPTPSTVAEALVADLGAAQLETVVSPDRGWLVASWLIAHAEVHGVSSVLFDGYRWSAHDGRWTPHPPSRAVVQVNA